MIETHVNPVKICALCAEDIPLSASLCPYCGARYQIASQGYCQTCHQVRKASAEGLCMECDSPLLDCRVESAFIEDAPPSPPPLPTGAPQPKLPARQENPKKAGLAWLFGLLVLVGGIVVVFLTIIDSLALIPALLAPKATATPSHTAPLPPTEITLETPQLTASLQPTDPPTPTPTQTRVPTQTPLPSWIANFAEPWLAARAAHDVFFQDDFESRGRGWELTLPRSTDRQQNRSGILDGVLRLSLEDLNPSITNPVIDKNRMILEFDARLVLSAPDASLALTGSYGEGINEIRLSAKGGQVTWDVCLNPSNQGERCITNPAITLAAGEWAHFLVILRDGQMALFFNGMPAAYLQDFYANQFDFHCTGGGPNMCEVDNLKLWYTFAWAEITPAPTAKPAATHAIAASPTAKPAATLPIAASPTATAPPTSGSGGARGLVEWNDQPYPGVTVNLCLEWKIFGGCVAPVYTGVSGSDGWYTISNIPPGEYRVASLVPGQGETGYLGLRAVVQAGQTVTVKTLDITKEDLQLASPGNNTSINTTTPTLSWQAYPDAAYYKLYVVYETGDYNAVVNFERVDGPSYTFGAAQGAGKYHWSVSAYNANGTEISESDTWYFTIAP